MVFVRLDLPNEHFFLFGKDFDSDVARTFYAHLFGLGRQTGEVDLTIFHTSLFLELGLDRLDFLIECLFLRVLVISVLDKLALQLEQLLVSELTALNLPSQLILQQFHALKVALLHRCLFFCHRVVLAS